MDKETKVCKVSSKIFEVNSNDDSLEIKHF